MCQSIILSSNGNTVITYCKKCRNHYIWQNSFLLSFNTPQFQEFVDGIRAKIGKEEYFLFPDGESRVLLNTPVFEITFTFSFDEWRDFTNTLEEARYMREVHELIH
ncbi:hypothetical protein [Sphingobacterium hungaricum]|uniref:Uncharacterized protein n=1 Tax=Sphingobacterium hungaricum TaxID=2082723 RepID=A0A928UWL4_9SPHI|nr:hypothetical protein [Sphingobacterium hungaricum]MBE8714037.1 hypothetical protein [Sphingobacterium hungaricum]